MAAQPALEPRMKMRRGSGVIGKERAFTEMEANQGGTAERISGHSVPCRQRQGPDGFFDSENIKGE